MRSSIDARVEGTEARRAGGSVVWVAGMWRRMAAALIDLLLFAPVLVGAGWLAIRVAHVELPSGVGGVGGAGGRGGLAVERALELLLGGGTSFYAILAFIFSLVGLYAFLFLTTTGTTPGLRLLRTEVIDIYGRRPEWWRVLVRCGGALLGLLTLGLGLLWIGFDREKRGLHDWLAGTLVIRRSAE